MKKLLCCLVVFGGLLAACTIPESTTREVLQTDLGDYVQSIDVNTSPEEIEKQYEQYLNSYKDLIATDSTQSNGRSTTYSSNSDGVVIKSISERLKEADTNTHVNLSDIFAQEEYLFSYLKRAGDNFFRGGWFSWVILFDYLYAFYTYNNFKAQNRLHAYRPNERHSDPSVFPDYLQNKCYGKDYSVLLAPRLNSYSLVDLLTPLRILDGNLSNSKLISSLNEFHMLKELYLQTPNDYQFFMSVLDPHLGKHYNYTVVKDAKPLDSGQISDLTDSGTCNAKAFR
ncbi:hypothetical protein P0082_03670 [Candidatus Haliotispira prima]|uniref:Lipoprotein n=1 Tax=Candidatus Haliotispira prima TaxID=3034016 RepID=A0ABY8MJ28_9SPIO|nr:hypothetical protein P0082_03670 [Candidatus Haliotispira prima]